MNTDVGSGAGSIPEPGIELVEISTSGVGCRAVCLFLTGTTEKRTHTTKQGAAIAASVELGYGEVRVVAKAYFAHPGTGHRQGGRRNGASAHKEPVAPDFPSTYGCVLGLCKW